MTVIVHIPEGIPLYILVQVQGVGVSVVYVKALVLGQEASAYPIIPPCVCEVQVLNFSLFVSRKSEGERKLFPVSQPVVFILLQLPFPEDVDQAAMLVIPVVFLLPTVLIVKFSACKLPLFCQIKRRYDIK